MNRDSLLGGGDDFPTTLWSQLLSTAHRNDREGTRALVEKLAANYWKPTYAFIRHRWRGSVEDARDLTQDFFIWLMNSDYLCRIDPAKGRLRAFLKAAVANYLLNERRKRGRQKRKSDRPVLSLDTESDGLARLEVVDGKMQTPEECLDEVWKQELLSRALKELKEGLAREEKGLYLEVFQDYYLTNTSENDYLVIAERHGISAADVSNYLARTKKKFKEILRGLVAETVHQPEDLADELRTLFGA